MCAPINSMVIGKNVTMTDRQTTGIGEDGEPSPTLQANHHHAVVCSQYGEIAGALTARYDSSPCVDRGQTVVASFMGGQGEKAGSLGFREECAPTLKGAPSGSNQVPDVLVTDKQCVSTRNLSSALTGTEACPAHAKVVCYENNPTDARQRETDVSPSVLARWGTGGNQTPLVQTFSISENVIGRDPKNGGNHLGVSDGPCFTLDVAGVHGVSSTGFVRRLTTVECARLQGFPDHHTEIPWRGKPAFECPNGPQYKAYGNSMCVNVMEWLGRKIQGEINANSTSKMAR